MAGQHGHFGHPVIFSADILDIDFVWIMILGIVLEKTVNHVIAPFRANVSNI